MVNHDLTWRVTVSNEDKISEVPLYFWNKKDIIQNQVNWKSSHQLITWKRFSSAITSHKAHRWRMTSQRFIMYAIMTAKGVLYWNLIGFFHSSPFHFFHPTFPRKTNWSSDEWCYKLKHFNGLLFFVIKAPFLSLCYLFEANDSNKSMKRE